MIIYSLCYMEAGLILYLEDKKSSSPNLAWSPHFADILVYCSSFLNKQLFTSSSFLNHPVVGHTLYLSVWVIPFRLGLFYYLHCQGLFRFCTFYTQW